jgi:hypothetical protein
MMMKVLVLGMKVGVFGIAPIGKEEERLKERS